MPQEISSVCDCGYCLDGLGPPPWTCPECGTFALSPRPPHPFGITRSDRNSALWMGASGCLFAIIAGALLSSPVGAAFALLAIVLSIGFSAIMALWLVRSWRRWVVVGGVVAFIMTNVIALVCLFTIATMSGAIAVGLFAP